MHSNVQLLYVLSHFFAVGVAVLLLKVPSTSIRLRASGWFASRLSQDLNVFVTFFFPQTVDIAFHPFEVVFKLLLKRFCLGLASRQKAVL